MSDVTIESVVEYLRSDEAERALTAAMHDHVHGHLSSNNPHYFGCDGPCASRAALKAMAREVANRPARIDGRDGRPAMSLTEAEIEALLCDCADEANSLACPGHTPAARHLWTEKSAAEILEAVERILTDRLAPVEESKNRWRVRAKRAQNECSDLRSIVGTGNDLWTPADSAQAYLARAEAAEAHLAAHEAREARVRVLADEWAKLEQYLKQRAPVGATGRLDAMDRREANTWNVAVSDLRAALNGPPA